MPKSLHTSLAFLLLTYAVAGLVHFVHNAEFLGDYPNMPASWSRAGVYFAWLGMTGVGVCGWLLLVRGFARSGLVLLAIYSALGLDSLGHYLLAPMSNHTIAMNVTILLEVAAAAALLIGVLRLLVRCLLHQESHEYDA
jgi:uncharacterized membrane protein